MVEQLYFPHAGMCICSIFQLINVQLLNSHAGHHVVVVSSGAVGLGCLKLKLQKRPKELAARQALAAVGQVQLMRYYEDFLTALGLVSSIMAACTAVAVCLHCDRQEQHHVVHCAGPQMPAPQCGNWLSAVMQATGDSSCAAVQALLMRE